MFNNYFWSSSVNYKSERMWILRLLYSGLNIEDDAQLYIRNSIPDTLLSFYSSPLSDDESRELVIEVKLTMLCLFGYGWFCTVIIEVTITLIPVFFYEYKEKH